MITIKGKQQTIAIIRLRSDVSLCTTKSVSIVGGKWATLYAVRKKRNGQPFKMVHIK